MGWKRLILFCFCFWALDLPLGLLWWVRWWWPPSADPLLWFPPSGIIVLMTWPPLVPVSPSSPKFKIPKKKKINSEWIVYDSFPATVQKWRHFDYVPVTKAAQFHFKKKIKEDSQKSVLCNMDRSRGGALSSRENILDVRESQIR